MWQKFKEQIPAIIVLAVVIGAVGTWMADRVTARQEAALAPIREQNEALRAQADASQRQLDATTQLLREAIGRRDSELAGPDSGTVRLSGGQVDALADAVAERVVPALPGPKTAEEMRRMEDEQADRISSRIADRVGPALASVDRHAQDAVQGAVAQDRIEIRSLNNRLQAANAAADDAIKLCHVITGQYLNSFNDQGAVVRVLSLPANILRDTVTGNLINSRDRDKVQKQLDAQMSDLERRLNQVQGQGSPMATSS